MRTRLIRGFLLVVLGCALMPLELHAQASGGASDLANQVNNPAAPITYIQFRNILVPDVAGTDGVTNSLEMQPVVPIGPFDGFPHIQLVKMTMPLYVVVPGTEDRPSGASGIGDLELFDVLGFKQSWGEWGFGPAFVFPTASADALGAGKWQLGPAVVAMYTGVKNLTAGAVVQNPISFAGSSSRASVNTMSITPTLTYTISKGWFVGLSDYDVTFDWENGGAATIPLGVQVGKVVHFGKQPVSLSVEAGGTISRPAGRPNPGLILGFEVTPIFNNFHIRSGKKAKGPKQE